MKNLCAVGLLAVCLLAKQQSVSAQITAIKQPLQKPLTLTKLPEKFECRLATLQKVSASRLSENVSLQLDTFQFAGQVVDKVQRAPGVLSMNIRSTNFPGALFTVSVITDENNNQKYVGRIVNPQSDDILILTEENNRYFLVKQPRQLIMVE